MHWGCHSLKLYSVQVTEFSFFVWAISWMCEWKFSNNTDLLCFYLISYPDFPKTLHCLWMLCHSERIFCFWFFLKRSSRSWRVFGAIPHSGIASNRNFLLFFLPWILRSVLHSGMSYPLSAAFDYSLPNTAPLCLRPVPPLLCFAWCFSWRNPEFHQNGS